MKEVGRAARMRPGSDREAMTPISRGDGDFDLVIIGGGSAGFGAAIKGAELGARVVMASAGTLGGTCVNVGCVPSKTLIRAAEARPTDPSPIRGNSRHGRPARLAGCAGTERRIGRPDATREIPAGTELV